MMKRIFTANNIAEAGLMRSYLEQHDIQCTMRNEHTSAVIGDLPFVDNDAELWVDAALSTQALELIRQMRQVDTTNLSDWACADCGEGNPGNFELCWQCQKARTLV